MTTDGLIALRERVAQADAIVSGTVTGIEAVDSTSEGPVSHHEPLWIAVTLRIDSVMRGDVTGEQLSPKWPGAPIRGSIPA